MDGGPPADPTGGGRGGSLQEGGGRRKIRRGTLQVYLQAAKVFITNKISRFCSALPLGSVVILPPFFSPTTLVRIQELPAKRREERQGRRG